MAGFSSVGARPVLEIPTRGHELIPIDWAELEESTDADSYSEVFEIIHAENAGVKYLVTLVEEVWRLGKWALAIDFLKKAVDLRRGDRMELLPLYCMLSTYAVALARKAPKVILQYPRTGKPIERPKNPNHPEAFGHAPIKTKDQYWSEAGAYLQEAERINPRDMRVKDAQGVLLLARGRFDEALNVFNNILSTEPNHLYALSGKARILFARRAYRPALKLYQQVLRFGPDFLPDPRIGIGLCLWMLGEREKAKKAWERSVAVHPNNSSTSATILLSLSYLNASRDPSLPGRPESEVKLYAKALELAKAAFSKDNTTAAAALPLAIHFLARDDYVGAMKLSERAVQFADARALVAEAHLQIARTIHAQGDLRTAAEEYSKSSAANSEQLISNLAIAQASIASDEIAAAINTLEGMLRKQPRCIEALVSLAALHTRKAFTSPGIADAQAERKTAKEYYDQALKLFNSGKEGDETNSAVAKSGRIKDAMTDEGLWVEIAKLWEDEASVERTLLGYKEAARLAEEKVAEGGNGASPQLLNNIAVLEFSKGNVGEALSRWEEAFAAVGEEIKKKGGDLSDQLDAVVTTVSYNLGVVYEANGEVDKAKEAYTQILSRHPEYVDAKARLAMIALKRRDGEKAHGLIKECLTAQPLHPEVRALYSYYLNKAHSPKIAFGFTRETLLSQRSNTRQDVYALCASGMIYYNEGRENKDQSTQGIKHRNGRFVGAADYFVKALTIDPQCAFAAQGLAIAIAEGNLGTGVETTGAAAPTDQAARAKNARDALTIFTKVKESMNEGSVYVNMGHCHFIREEYERAIESYETASKRYYNGRDTSVLLYLARTWYHKASYEKSFSDIQQALVHARAALALEPNELFIVFNVAMILQKGIEILTPLDPSKRTLSELEQAFANCDESITLFQQLADDKTETPTYPKETAFQRQRYGANLSKKSADVLAAQVEYEKIEQARVDEAKRLREAERERIAKLEEERQAAIALQAQQLAEQRRIMREEAATYVVKSLVDSDEEEKERAKERKKKEGGGKKRTKKSKKEDGESTGEEEDKPKPKRTKKKKAVVKDDEEDDVEMKDKEDEGPALDSDGEEAVRPNKRKTGRGGKAFKSSEFVDSESSGEE